MHCSNSNVYVACPGGEAGAEVRKELEAKRDVLVTNYITKLTELLAELLPKVRHRTLWNARRMLWKALNEVEHTSSTWKV